MEVAIDAQVLKGPDCGEGERDDRRPFSALCDRPQANGRRCRCVTSRQTGREALKELAVSSMS